MDLNDTLGTLPSGRRVRLSDDDLTMYLRDRYRTDAEEKRRRDARYRLDFYHDAALPHLKRDFDAVFHNTRIREWHKAMLPFALYQNLTRRVVREKSAVYSEPAVRTIRKANERYQAFQRALNMDRRMRVVNELTNLVNAVLLYPWVKGDEPRLDVIPQDRFWAICDRNDPGEFVGAIVDRVPRGPGVKPTDSHYLCCDGETWFHLDADWRMVPGSRQPHGLGRLPVILHLREIPASGDDLLADTAGGDIVSAHRAIVLLNALMLRAQKSATQQPVATGDTSTMARDQPLDRESVIEAPEGVAFSTIDLRADPNDYLTAARDIMRQLAANHGIPPAMLALEDTGGATGVQIRVRRMSLQEIRRDQILDYRRLEASLAELQSLVTRGTQYAFNAAGWSVDFGEVEIPLDPTQRLNYWKTAQDMGLLNVYEMYRATNPELSERDVVEAVARNDTIRLERMRMYQEQNASLYGPKGTPNAPTDRAGDRMPMDDGGDGGAEVAE